MKLVDGGQVVDRQMVDVLAGLLQGGEDAVEQPATAVVALDLGRAIGHLAISPIIAARRSSARAGGR